MFLFANVHDDTCIWIHNEKMSAFWLVHSDVQEDIVFIEAPPFPLLWFASGVYSSSRWHHCPGRGKKILYENTAWNPFIACLHCSTRRCHWSASGSTVAHLCWPTIPGFAPLHCGCNFALAGTWMCEHHVVCLLAEAEHGYASMPPFISSRERESLKRKSKSKKNTSSR